MGALNADHGNAAAAQVGGRTYPGLSGHEAALRLAAEGPNELPASQTRNLWMIALEVLREPMFVLLTVACAIYVVLGDLREALILFASVMVIVAITIYQERKTERALEALRDLSSPRALVIREGVQMRIAGREVVHGDLVLMKEGDRVPADAVLLEASDFTADESLLTGESVPVRKTAWDGAQQFTRPGGDDLPFVYSGALVTQGHGVAEVLATGSATEIGKIGRALATLETETTPLQRQTRRAVVLLAALGITLSVLVAVLYGMFRGGWLDGALAGITLAMAILPEEFPVVLTVFLALGAWRISRQEVLTRRMPAIEALGAATVLCVDKTGTLTMNRMTVRRLFCDGYTHDMPAGASPPPESFHDLVEYSILASESDPFDPMEKAFIELGARALDRDRLHADWKLAREYPLSPALLVHAHGWRLPGRQQFVVAAKGAPEAVAGLCALSPDQRIALDAEVARMADDGLRVLAVARADFAGGAWPSSVSAFRFTLLGLIGLADPVRPTVAAALAECYGAGIRVVMITGDYPGTARAIARQIGLAGGSDIITGAGLDAMSDEELRRRIGHVTIFARVVPEQKLRLVNAFKANGEVVAMTGDGVNDAPALKAAHIGIAMGGRGTDVAREAAALVLLDDDFSSIVHAVSLGRRVYDNIRNAMCYLLAVHVPTAGMAFVPLVFGWPMVFFPVHIVFLEFVIDPACSIAFEAEPSEADAMRRGPRAPGEPLFGFGMVLLSVLQGLSVLLMVALMYGYVLLQGAGETEARAMAFTTIVFGNLGLILANRSRTGLITHTLRRPNRALWWVVGGTLAGVALVLYVPYLRDLFRFAPLHGEDLAICFAAALAGLVWFELYKLRLARRAA